MIIHVVRVGYAEIRSRYGLHSANNHYQTPDIRYLHVQTTILRSEGGTDITHGHVCTFPSSLAQTANQTLVFLV